MSPTEAVCRELCESRKFNGGDGVCAALCMQTLGDARSGPHGCPYRTQVFEKLAERIVDALKAST